MYTLNKISETAPTELSKSVSGAVSALEKGSFVKLICGAANTNAKRVERLALVYSLSGVEVIDVSSSQEIIYAAKTGIKKAYEFYKQSPKKFPRYNEPALMVSLDIRGDLHFRKVKINYEKCVNCFKCVDSCPSGALFVNSSPLFCHPETPCHSEGNSLQNDRTNKNDKKIQINKNNCYGCGRCSEACRYDAIEFINLNNSHNLDLKEVKTLEIHTGNNSIEEVKNFLEFNSSLLNNMELLSFCVESKRFSPKELQDYVNKIINMVNKKVIIQIDGNPMGATDKLCSSLQAISAAAILLENNTNAYVQIAGATNLHTKNLVQQLGLKISGIGYGTFARKIILSYIDELVEDDFCEQLQQIVNITTSLVDN